jgi:hypothetical protein
VHYLMEVFLKQCFTMDWLVHYLMEVFQINCFTLDWLVHRRDISHAVLYPGLASPLSN